MHEGGVLIINHTNSFCPDCQMNHPARYEQKGNNIYFIVECPKERFSHLMSTDADLFKKMRAKVNYDFSQPPEYPNYRHINLIEITNDCNFNCRFCFSSSNRHGIKTYKSLDEIIKIGKAIKKERGYEITLSGGEPTLHRQLPEIVKSLKKLGLVVNMVSNGYLLGKDQSLARVLRKSGLTSVGLQLDSLNEATHYKQRNNIYVKEKIEAIKNCIEAGVRIAIAITVTKYNLNELGDIIRFCLQFRPHLYMIVLQPYFPIGHTELKEDSIVDKEEILRSIEAGLSPMLSPEFFRPAPRFRPMNLEIHPDCGAWTALVAEKDSLYPIDKFVNMSVFCAKLAKVKARFFPFRLGYIALFYFLFTSSYKGKRVRLLRSIFGSLRGKGDFSLVLIEVEQFMHSRLQDEQRAARCATVYRTRDGINQKGCIANRID